MKPGDIHEAQRLMTLMNADMATAERLADPATPLRLMLGPPDRQVEVVIAKAYGDRLRAELGAAIEALIEDRRARLRELGVEL